MLSVAAMALALGAAAWVADISDSTPLVSAALPPAVAPSFEDRFASASTGPSPRELGLRVLERSAVNAAQLRLRDAKAMLAQKLQGDEWRSILSEDDRYMTEEARRSQRADAIPMPRARPVQADFSAQIASSQAYADTNLRVDNRNFFEKFTDKIKLASLTPGDGLLGRGPDLAALGYDSRTAVYDISAKAVYLPSGVALEAHSGLGALMDNPDHVDRRMVGATPPAIYDLKPREKPFHGVRALRMTPVEGTSALAASGCSRTITCSGRVAIPTAASRSRTMIGSSRPTTMASSTAWSWFRACAERRPPRNARAPIPDLRLRRRGCRFPFVKPSSSRSSP